MNFQDKSGKRVRITKTQIVRPQAPNITALSSRLTPDFGTVDVSDNDWNTTIDGSSSDLIRWRSGRTVEMLQTFPKPLPFPLYAPIVPNLLLRFWIRDAGCLPGNMPRFLKRLLMHRHEAATYVDEYNHPDSFQEFSAGHTSHLRLCVQVSMHESIPEDKLTLNAIRLFGVTATREPVSKDGRMFTLQTRLAPNENLRLWWHRKCAQCDSPVATLSDEFCERCGDRARAP
jgi:hypothetical protein